VARGILPAISEDAPLRPRGLLIGTPAGLTFEYRVDDVRLLGVRQGEFVARDDWIGRGGSPLRPLGTLIQLQGDGDPPPTFSSDGEPLHARFTGTTVDDDGAVVLYRLEREDGVVLAYVEERITPWTLEQGSGWTRTLLVLGAGLNAIPLDVLQHPLLPDQEMRRVESIVLPDDGVAIWRSAAKDDPLVPLIGTSTAVLRNGLWPTGLVSMGTDGLISSIELEPEQRIEIRIRTFFPREASPSSEDGEVHR